MGVCAKCKNLNIKDRKEGSVAGAKYWCKLKECYVCADENGDCGDKFKEDDKRKKDEIAKAIDDGKNYDNIRISNVGLLIIIIILLIVGKIMNLF